MSYYNLSKIFLSFLLCLPGFNLYAQTFSTNANQAGVAVAPTDHFSYLGKDVSFYSLGWYYESVDWPPYAYLSSYSGIKFFTGGLPRTYIDLNGNMGVNTLSPREKFDVWGGNISVTGADHNGTAVIGSSEGVAFFSNNSYTNGLAVAPNGNVGIGTRTPEELFEIKANQPVITFHQPGISSFKMGTSNGVFKLQAMDNGFGGHTGNFSNAGNPYVFSFLQNGNVGIGTAEASEKLVVNGNFKLILDQGTFPAKNVVNIVALGYSGITGAKNWALRSVYQYGHGVANNADGGDLDVIKSLNGSTILATKTDGSPLGYVGIGVTTPTERLTVNGKIKANEIRVDGTNAPDYVFEEDYKVATLAELERYIKANKHLPEIPSAKEFERDGIAVGEMNKLLLKKIEELTLHLIEKDKQYGELLNDVKKQELRLRLLEKKLDK
ncbi:hypothetical protein [Pedobacter sp.]|uniref:hypothetical protein n=1 Tax=Pedobacter sp. TaxID=1411316 RepID=UPI0031D19BBC